MSDKTDPCAKLETRIPALPGIMRNQGWTIGPKLMEHWLEAAPNNDPAKNIHRHDITTVKMNWVLGFPRAVNVYQMAINGRVWVNQAAQKEIIEKLIRNKGRLPATVGGKIEFGNVGEGQARFAHTAEDFHKNWHIQNRSFQQELTDPLDDLYAALGDFHFYFLVKGWVTRLKDQDTKPHYKVMIEKVGMYVRDSYDFNDPDCWYCWVVPSQPLGFWSCEKNYAAKLPRPTLELNPIPFAQPPTRVVPDPSAHYVNNASFRAWRNSQGKGGDFLVFSDIKVFNVNDSFEF